MLAIEPNTKAPLSQIPRPLIVNKSKHNARASTLVASTTEIQVLDINKCKIGCSDSLNYQVKTLSSGSCNLRPHYKRRRTLYTHDSRFWTISWPRTCDIEEIETPNSIHPEFLWNLSRKYTNYLIWNVTKCKQICCLRLRKKILLARHFLVLVKIKYCF